MFSRNISLSTSYSPVRFLYKSTTLLLSDQFLQILQHFNFLSQLMLEKLQKKYSRKHISKLKSDPESKSELTCSIRKTVCVLQTLQIFISKDPFWNFPKILPIPLAIVKDKHYCQKKIVKKMARDFPQRVQKSLKISWGWHLEHFKLQKRLKCNAVQCGNMFGNSATQR